MAIFDVMIRCKKDEASFPLTSRITLSDSAMMFCDIKF